MGKIIHQGVNYSRTLETDNDINELRALAKVNATALADGDAIAVASDGFYYNVEDGKVYEVKEGIVTETSKEIDTCEITYALYSANKAILDSLDILFVITNAPSSSGSEGQSSKTSVPITFSDGSTMTMHFTKQGDIIHVDAIKTSNPSGKFSTGGTWVDLGTIPSGYRPARNTVIKLITGNVLASILIQFLSTGAIRYYNFDTTQQEGYEVSILTTYILGA